MDYRIVVDAGHGGDDPGAVSGGLREKDFTLEAANYMYNRFKELGVPVAITRDSDVTLSRQQRLNTMNNSFGTDPKVIILFGNQVSSIVLDEKISVSQCRRKLFKKCINGKYYDTIFMDILKSEFKENYIRNKNI